MNGAIGPLQNIGDYQERLEAIYASTSWRITMPIRVVGRLIKGETQFNLWMAARKMLIAVLRRLMRKLVPLALSQKSFRSMGHRIAKRYPAFAIALKRLLGWHSSPIHTSFSHGVAEMDLSPKARLVLAQLKTTLAVR